MLSIETSYVSGIRSFGHMRNLGWKELQEVSANMPDSIVRKTDESLRNLGDSDW